jgi:hypothetical protein
VGSGERTGLIHRAERRDAVHNLRVATVSRDGQSTTDDFAECRQVGLDSIKWLAGAVAQAKSGDDLVHDEQRAVLLGQIAQAGQKTFCGEHDAHICGDRLHNDRGNLALVMPKEALDSGEIVVRSVECEFGQNLRHSRAFGDTQSGETRTGLR